MPASAALRCAGGLGALLLWFAFACAPAAAAVPADAAQAVLGNWLTQDRDGIIEISRAADGSYQGRIVGGDDPNGLDTKNPDAALRGRALRGVVILRALHYDGGGSWSGGLIYDPDSGHQYHVNLALLAEDRLQIHGYIGIPLLGRSQTWTRYLGTSMDLPKSGITR